MSNSVTSFEDEIDHLVDSVVDQLVSALPAGALRSAQDDTVLRACGSLERLGRLVDARRAEAAGELAHRSRPTLGSAALAVRKGCRDAVELVRRVSLASTVTVRQRIRIGTETRPQEALSGDLFPARFPHLAEALEHGNLGLDAAVAIVTELAPTLTRADPAAVRAAEAELVAAATGAGPESALPCTAEQVRGQATVWRAFLDEDGTLPAEERAMARRTFSPGSYNTVDGLVHGKYALMPEVHAKLGKIFDACLTPKTGPTFLPEGHEPAGPVDTRTADQQRHDVFAAMVDGFSRSGTAPTIGGASPTVLVSVTADTLRSGHGAGFVSSGGPGGATVPISLKAVHQMICTGGIQRISLDDRGAVISLGTEQRCFTPAQRRAITLRDGGCVIPGCTIPASWCEIHHVTPDSAGGPTHTDNGVLLCWFHHRTIGTSGWDIRMIDKVPHVKAPGWLGGDGHWHPATTSPTRQSERIRRTRQPQPQSPPEQSPTRQSPPKQSHPERGRGDDSDDDAAA